ncbi:MAG TPA: adenosylcobalamin-dependent ribonucleoside-diphosphate reductase [bacterium]|nr:adenosylcobalamin-dependent ribonucleoside-diphosphate reductase [bacterium]
MNPLTIPIKRKDSESLEDRLSENVKKYVLPARYLLKDRQGTVEETPDQLFQRVAKNLARPEREYGNNEQQIADEFFDMLTTLQFMPNSPTLMNAGAELQQLAACFVISPDDDLDSIFETVKRAAKIFQSGGGVGYAFSKLRPKGDMVQSTGGIASGPVSFMHVFDQMCSTLKQGGKRRGAQMGMLHVDHPDIGRFVVAKRQEGVLSNFNISAAITDRFYEAVKKDEPYPLINPRNGQPFQVIRETAHFYSTEYKDASAIRVEENLWRDYAEDIQGIVTYQGATDLTVGTPMRLPARFIWNLLVDGAWKNGEPGLFMVDETNREHSFDLEEYPDHRIMATNPCAEQPLEDYEACTLGHINLSLMLSKAFEAWPSYRHSNSGPLTKQVSGFLSQAVDWERLGHVVRLGTRFLDNAITMSNFPLHEIKEKSEQLRNIGLGVMGFAQMLLQLQVIYGSGESFEIARQIMRFIIHESKKASHHLAKKRGPFREWNHSKYAQPASYPDWFRRHTGQDPNDWQDGFPLRNHHTTTVAPTGTTSMIANTSGGCEPLFNTVYFRNVGRDIQGEDVLIEFDDYFLQVLEANGYDVKALKEEAKSLMRTNRFASTRDLSIAGEIADIFITADRIAPEDHVRMQAAFQEFIDSGISKTINFPKTATRDDVDRAFRLAIDLGCKGLTFYRLGSRKKQVLYTTQEMKPEQHHLNH